MTASSKTLTYHTYGLGSVRALSDGSGQVIQSYQTDEFGKPTLRSGPSRQPFGFTGEPWDPETGLLYLRARHYVPAIGRFFQRDSFGGFGIAPQTLNRYSCVGNNPVRFTDPSGHCGGLLCIAIGGGLIVIGGAGVYYSVPPPWLLPGSSVSTGYNPYIFGEVERATQALEFANSASQVLGPMAFTIIKHWLRSLGVLPPPGTNGPEMILRASGQPPIKPDRGPNRVIKELHRAGWMMKGPTRSPGGRIYQNPATGEEIRIMPRPPIRHRGDPPEKHSSEWYYRYRPGPSQSEGPHIPIPNK